MEEEKGKMENQLSNLRLDCSSLTRRFYYNLEFRDTPQVKFSLFTSPSQNKVTELDFWNNFVGFGAFWGNSSADVADLPEGRSWSNNYSNCYWADSCCPMERKCSLLVYWEEVKEKRRLGNKRNKEESGKWWVYFRLNWQPPCGHRGLLTH